MLFFPAMGFYSPISFFHDMFRVTVKDTAATSPPAVCFRHMTEASVWYFLQKVFMIHAHSVSIVCPAAGLTKTAMAIVLTMVCRPSACIEAVCRTSLVGYSVSNSRTARARRGSRSSSYNRAPTIRSSSLRITCSSSHSETANCKHGSDGYKCS